MTTTQKRAASIAAGLALLAGGIYYWLSPTGPLPLTATAFDGGVELSWGAEWDKFYSIGYATNPHGPWREILAISPNNGVALGGGSGNFQVFGFPPTSDSNSQWGCTVFADGQMSNRLMHAYFSISNETKGFFHLWTRELGATIAMPAPLRIERK